MSNTIARVTRVERAASSASVFDGLASAYSAMTERRVAELRRRGAGSGRDENYQPWIRIRRKLSSPVSNLCALPVPQYARALQLLSGLETAAANVAIWLQPDGEIREQHPLWPDEHPHPLCGRHPDMDRLYPPAPGLRELARNAGIVHGVYPGTHIPFVATIDFTVTVGPWHRPGLVHWSGKPRELLDSAPNRSRMLERIEMERLYSHAVGAKHVVIDGTQYSQKLVANLDWLRPLRSEITNLLCPSRLKAYGAEFMRVAGDRPVEAAEAVAAKQVRVHEKKLADAYFRAAAWYGYVEVDMSRDIIKSVPLRRDTGLKARLRRELLGVNHV